MSKPNLTFLRRSILQQTVTPNSIGTLHFIAPKPSNDDEAAEEGIGRYQATLGNTFLAVVDRRPIGIDSWEAFKDVMIPLAVADERLDLFVDRVSWRAEDAEEVGAILAEEAGRIWYPRENA